MFVIFGTRSVERRVPDGITEQQVCSGCNSLQKLHECKNEKFFTLFFIPLIPMGQEGPSYFKCQSCKASFYIQGRSSPAGNSQRIREVPYEIIKNKPNLTIIDCPWCSQKLRVPKEKEKYNIKCSSCGSRV